MVDFCTFKYSMYQGSKKISIRLLQASRVQVCNTRFLKNNFFFRWFRVDFLHASWFQVLTLAAQYL